MLRAEMFPVVAAGAGHGMGRLMLGASAVEDPELYQRTSPVEMGAPLAPVPAIHGDADHFHVIEPDGHAWPVARKWLHDKLS